MLINPSSLQHNESLFAIALKFPFIGKKFCEQTRKVFFSGPNKLLVRSLPKIRGFKSMALKNYDELNSISDGKHFLNGPASSCPSTPSFTSSFSFGINISLSELKGNYIENLCHSIITDTQTPSHCFSYSKFNIACLVLDVFNVF